VFCSARCRSQYSKKGDRYPSIGGLPLEARNQVAELIALVRSARRQIHGNVQSSSM
jgi:hypothetical protein